jgi:hypothetical protein
MDTNSGNMKITSESNQFKIFFFLIQMFLNFIITFVLRRRYFQ